MAGKIPMRQFYKFGAAMLVGALVFMAAAVLILRELSLRQAPASFVTGEVQRPDALAHMPSNPPSISAREIDEAFPKTSGDVPVADEQNKDAIDKLAEQIALAYAAQLKGEAVKATEVIKRNPAVPSPPLVVPTPAVIPPVTSTSTKATVPSQTSGQGSAATSADARTADLRKQLEVMPARYNTPKALGYGRTTTIVFALETQGAGTATESFVGLTGDVATADVLVGAEVRALLSGPSDLVDIKPRDPSELQRKTVSRIAPVQWTWDVKGVGVGTAVLQLELVAFVDNGKSSPPLQVKTFHQSIPIEISLTDRIVRSVADLDPVWKFGATVVTGLAAVLAWFGFKPGRGDKAASSSGDGGRPDPPPDPARPKRPSIYGSRRSRRT